MANHSTHTILRDGFTSIVRSPAFATATGVVAFLASMLLVATMVVYGFSGYLRQSIAQKVDMNVYFFPSADPSIVSEFAQAMQNRPEVDSATIIGRDQALADFKTRHANDALTLQALDELGENPLGASVVIQTHEPSQLKSVALLLDGNSDAIKAFSPYIERVNYFDHDQIIARFNTVSSTLKGVAVASVSLTLLIVILLMYTMAKVHMVAEYEMHETKRLLGAQTAHIVAPRVISSAVIVAIAATLAIVVSVIAAWEATRLTQGFFEGFRFDSFLFHGLPAVCAIVYSILFLCAIITTLTAYATTKSPR